MSLKVTPIAYAAHVVHFGQFLDGLINHGAMKTRRHEPKLRLLRPTCMCILQHTYLLDILALKSFG